MARPPLTGFEGIPPSIAKQWQALTVPYVEPGPEFLGVPQLMKLWNMGKAACHARMRRLEEAGKVEVRWKIESRPDAGGGIRRKVYRLK